MRVARGKEKSGGEEFHENQGERGEAKRRFVGVGKWWGKQRVRDYSALRLLLIFLPGDDA